MTDERKQSLRAGRKIGAVLGGLVFLAVGIVPGFYFGSFGTLLMLNHLFGGTVDPTVIVRMMLVIGTVVGIFCVGSVSIVVGSIIGTALGYVADLFRAPVRSDNKVTAQ